MPNDLISAESPTPMALMQMAIQQNADLEKLEKLMDLQERWEKKEARKSFLEALSKFQTMAPQLKKTKTANIPSKDPSRKGFSYKYADLGTITSQIKKPLNDCGLSYRWEFQEQGDKMKVTCLVSHRDGHTETTSMEAGRDASGAKNDIQQKGSTHTYLQRYTLIGALGLSTADEDNDGKSNSRAIEKNEMQLSEEEVLDLWKQSVNDCKTKIALTALYKQNEKKVDADDKIKAIFKKRQDELKNEQQAKFQMA